MEFCAPIGEHVCKLAGQIGVQVHTNLSTMTVCYWKNVDSGEKEVIIQNLAVVVHKLDFVVFITFFYTLCYIL